MKIFLPLTVENQSLKCEIFSLLLFNNSLGCPEFLVISRLLSLCLMFIRHVLTHNFFIFFCGGFFWGVFCTYFHKHLFPYFPHFFFPVFFCFYFPKHILLPLIQIFFCSTSQILRAPTSLNILILSYFQTFSLFFFSTSLLYT